MNPGDVKGYLTAVKQALLYFDKVNLAPVVDVYSKADASIIQEIHSELPKMINKIKSQIRKDNELKQSLGMADRSGIDLIRLLASDYLKDGAGQKQNDFFYKPQLHGGVAFRDSGDLVDAFNMEKKLANVRGEKYIRILSVDKSFLEKRPIPLGDRLYVKSERLLMLALYGLALHPEIADYQKIEIVPKSKGSGLPRIKHLLPEKTQNLIDGLLQNDSLTRHIFNLLDGKDFDVPDLESLKYEFWAEQAAVLSLSLDCPPMINNPQIMQKIIAANNPYFYYTHLDTKRAVPRQNSLLLLKKLPAFSVPNLENVELEDVLAFREKADSDLAESREALFAYADLLRGEDQKDLDRAADAIIEDRIKPAFANAERIYKDHASFWNSKVAAALKGARTVAVTLGSSLFNMPSEYAIATAAVGMGAWAAYKYKTHSTKVKPENSRGLIFYAEAGTKLNLL
jgi:hypothetical protein